MRLALSVSLLALVAPVPFAVAGPPQPATFSIVAVDPESGEAGVAVASRAFAVGTVSRSRRPEWAPSRRRRARTRRTGREGWTSSSRG